MRSYALFHLLFCLVILDFRESLEVVCTVSIFGASNMTGAELHLCPMCGKCGSTGDACINGRIGNKKFSSFVNTTSACMQE